MVTQERITNWPFNTTFQIKKASEAAKDIFLKENCTWRQAIASSLHNEANMAIATRNGQIFPNPNEVKLRALFGYRASMETLFKLDGFNVDSYTPLEISKELLEDVTNEGKPFAYSRSWPESFTITPMAREFYEGFNRKTQPDHSFLNAIVSLGVNYHLRKNGEVDNAFEWEILRYMFGDKVPGVINEVLKKIGRPTLAGRIEAIHDFSVITRILRSEGYIEPA